MAVGIVGARGDTSRADVAFVIDAPAANAPTAKLLMGAPNPSVKDEHLDATATRWVVLVLIIERQPILINPVESPRRGTLGVGDGDLECGFGLGDRASVVAEQELGLGQSGGDRGAMKSVEYTKLHFDGRPSALAAAQMLAAALAPVVLIMNARCTA